MTQRVVARMVLMAFVVALGAGCTAPQAEVRQVSLQGLSLQEIALELTLNLYNPNKFAMPIDRIDWDFSLFETSVADGQARPDTEIPAEGDAQVDVPITMALAESSETVRRMINATQIPWSVEGTCHFQLPSTTVGVDFSQAGQWDNPLR